MDNKIKIIKLKTTNSDKSNLYKDILSSSDKVKAIIKKTKANRNKYRREKNEPLKLDNIFNYNDINPVSKEEKTFDTLVNLKCKKESLVSKEEKTFDTLVNLKCKKESLVSKEEKTFDTLVNLKCKKEKSQNDYLFPKKTKHNKTKFFKYEPKGNCIKTKKNVYISSQKSKKIATNLFKKSNSILKYFDNKKKQTMKIFTKKQIDKFVNVLNYYAEYEQYKNINNYIKKLNKYQTIQILFNLKLIAKKSSAPISLLKSILFTYFYSSITIS